MQHVIQLEPFDVCINNPDKRQVIVKYDIEDAVTIIMSELRKQFNVAFKGQDNYTNRC